MARRSLVKLAQLAALPALLVLASVAVEPRHPRRPDPAASHETPSERFFAAGASPSGRIDLARVVAPVRSETPNTWFQVTVIGTFPDEAGAERAARELGELEAAAAKHLASSDEARARLLDERHAAPLTPPEAAAFAKRGLRSEIGVGWPAAASVVALGRVVAVPGLKGDFAGLRPNPLVSWFEAEGARVLVEGDPAGGASPVVDLTAETPEAARLARALESYLAAPGSLFLRPPWHPAGVTPDEERARATLVAIDRAVRRALVDPRLYEAIRDKLRWSRDPAEVARLVEESRRSASLAALESVARQPERDPSVADEMRRVLAESAEWTRDPALRRRLAPRLGASIDPAPEERAYGATGRVQVQGTRVALGRVSFQRFARGLPALLAWLRSGGAAEARLALSAATPRPRLEVEDEDE